MLSRGRHGEAETKGQPGTEQGFANEGLAKASGAHHVSGVEQGKRFWLWLNETKQTIYFSVSLLSKDFRCCEVSRFSPEKPHISPFAAIN